MKLVGLLDSPFVRRTFISARMLGIPFEHLPLSVFRTFDAFHALNPLVKAPTLILDDGEVMVDSNAIIAWLERLAGPGHSLQPAAPAALRRSLQLTGIGLAAAEKSVHRVFELKVRGAEFRDPAWLQRIEAQLAESYVLLERLAARSEDDWLCGDSLCQADITVAVAWRFTHFTAPGLLAASDFPHLAALSARAEALPAFIAADFS